MVWLKIEEDVCEKTSLYVTNKQSTESTGKKERVEKLDDKWRSE